MKTTLILLLVSINFLISCTDCKHLSDLSRFNLKGNVKSIITIEYSAIEKFGEIHKNSFKEKMVESFNNDGNTTELIYFYPINRIFFKIIHKYSETGFDYSAFVSDSAGKLFFESKVYFNELGDKIVDHIQPDSTLKEKQVNKFNRKGWVMEKNLYNSEGVLISRQTLIRDRKGNVIESTIIDKKTNEETKEVYKYDKVGNIVESTTTARTTSEKFKYHYDKIDKYGNWLIRTETEPPMNITEREILYN